jgi:Uma2 family endonuclease
MPYSSYVHQKIGTKLLITYGDFIDSTKANAEVLGPCNLRLFPHSTDIRYDTNLIPDVAVAAKGNNDKLGFVGAPLLVVEILSPSNKKHDTKTKFELYEEAGVPEYWIIDPEAQTLSVNLLIDGKYQTQEYKESATVPVKALPGLSIGLGSIFA